MGDRAWCYMTPVLRTQNLSMSPSLKRLQPSPSASLSPNLPPQTFPPSECLASLQDYTVVYTPFTRLLVGKDRGVKTETAMHTLFHSPTNSLLLFSHSGVSVSLWPMDCSTPGFPVLQYPPEFAHIHVHRVSDAIQSSLPLSSLLLLPSVLPSIRVFSSESVLHVRWPKNWSFSFSISLSN